LFKEEFDKNILRFYAYIEDNDLWRHALPKSAEFSKGLANRRIEYDITLNPNLFTDLQYFDVDELVKLGELSIHEDHLKVQESLKSAFPVRKAILELFVLL